MIDDTSLEFDMFEDARQKLCEVFTLEGHSRLDAERLALYVVQGVRDVPRFLVVVAEKSPENREELLRLLQSVIQNAAGLEKAGAMLYGRIDPSTN